MASTADQVVNDRAQAYDEHYRTASWKSHCWTRESLEARFAYALDVNNGGNLNGKEIQYAFSLLGVPDLTGKRILDYCCGTGRVAIYFALCGADVWAFDASSEAIDIAVKSAQMTGVLTSTHFRTANAESLPYEDNSFDAVFCQSALHIVIDYPRCPLEIARVLKPEARAIFCEEALGYNPFLMPIRWLRGRKWVKCGGRSLRYPDIKAFGRPFSQTEVQHFNLLAQAKTAFKDQLDRRGFLLPWAKMLLRSLEKCDATILKIAPFLKRYCGAIVVSFEK